MPNRMLGVRAYSLALRVRALRRIAMLSMHQRVQGSMSIRNESVQPSGGLVSQHTSFFTFIGIQQVGIINDVGMFFARVCQGHDGCVAHSPLNP